MRPLLIPLAALLAYGSSMQGTFHFDDSHTVVQNPHIRTLADPARFFTSREPFSVDHDKTMYRPLVVLSLAVNHALGDYDPRGYLAFNLAAHIGAALAVWWVAGLLGASYAGALVAGLMFAVHPACAEPVNYVSARSEGMAVLFGLLGVGLWLRECAPRSQGSGL